MSGHDLRGEAVSCPHETLRALGPCPICPQQARLRQVLQDTRASIFIGDAAHLGDVIAANSIDAIITDPPAGVGFMGKAWDKDKGGRDAWIAWLREIMRGALRVLKPGGHALVWALPRTSHWTATAIEDAGFEIRDVVMHLFGSGFPKSLDVSKAIDAHAKATRTEVLRPGVRAGVAPDGSSYGSGLNAGFQTRELLAPATAAAAAWQGWGTALKPACEHWILARKPLDGTVAENVLAHGTGGLNVDACRVGDNGGGTSCSNRDADGRCLGHGNAGMTTSGETVHGPEVSNVGRWPANLILSHDPRCVAVNACVPDCAVRALDSQAGERTSGSRKPGVRKGLGYHGASGDGGPAVTGGGGASRFFYVAKPSKAETEAGLDHLPIRTGGEATDREDGSAGLNSPRAGAGRGGGRRNHHPTKKPVELMRYLIRLITPPGGAMLDMFAGTGTTGVAALAEGMRCVLIEQGGDTDPSTGEGEYVPIIMGRVQHALRNTRAPRDVDDPT